jgi:hypothetical protein
VHSDQYGATGLSGNLARFERDRMVTVGKTLLDRIQHNIPFGKIKADTAIMAISACSASLEIQRSYADHLLAKTKTFDQ